MSSIGSPSPFFLAGKKKAHEVERSLRFNDGDTPKLTRTPSSAGNQRTWTFSVWLKRGNLGTSLKYIYRVDGSHTDRLEFDSSDRLFLQQYDTNIRITTRKFRDVSAWYHIVIAMDTTQATADNRTKVYVNGEEVTEFDTKANNSQNTDGVINSTNEHNLGYSFDGYMAEVNFIDGSQLTPASFGETDSTTGQWNPIEYTGSYGSQGFYLNFSDNSGTTATTLGKDSSGNGNNWTPANFSVSAGDGNDSVTDTPTLNKATLNGLTGFTYNATLKNGNLEMTGSGGFKEISTIAVAGTSKFYYEVVRTISAGWQILGVFVGQPNNPSHPLNNTQIYGFATIGSRYEGGGGAISGSPSWSTDDVVGLKYNNGTLQIYVNGTLYATSITGIPTTDIVSAYIANDNTNAAAFARFNSDSWTQASAASVDATWELSTSNLPDPTILLPNKHFGIITYTGDGTDNRLVSDTSAVNFTPDYSVIKTRDFAYGWWANVDIVRGVSKFVRWNLTDAEATNAAPFNSFNNGGFTVSSNIDTTLANKNNETYVAYNWKGGGTASSNSDGTITSSVSANTSAGFSIVSYTGTGADGTVGHGLGVTPDAIILKNRDRSVEWIVKHKSLTSGNILYLNLSAAADGATGSNNGIIADLSSSSTFSITRTSNSGNYNNVGVNGEKYIAYCFSEVAGYSKFGSYVGNGSSSDGVFVFLGFKPALVIYKKYSNSDNWELHDNTRDTFNPVNKSLFPNTTAAESANRNVDFLSNGFKHYNANGNTNESGENYIYLAFAESPFKNARAR